MKNKNKLKLTTIACLLGATTLLAGCGSRQTNLIESESASVSEEIFTEKPAPTEPILINYSFMYDESTKNEIREIMSADGVNNTTIDDFMKTVSNFSDILGSMKGAAAGFTTVDSSSEFYDMEHIAVTLDKKLGYDDQNCRLTAYSLFNDFFSADSASDFEDSDNSLYGDFEILKGNKNLDFSGDDIKKYTALFSSVETEATTDPAVHAQHFKTALAERGITFNQDDRVQLASVMLHDPLTNTIFAGHAGVVFKTSDGYLLIEKLAQYTPFMAVKFSNIEDLKTYMVSEISYSYKDGAEPFLILNDELV